MRLMMNLQDREAICVNTFILPGCCPLSQMYVCMASQTFPAQLESKVIFFPFWFKPVHFSFNGRTPHLILIFKRTPLLLEKLQSVKKLTCCTVRKL